MLNLYTRDPQAVAACEAEFARYLALCRPLMEIYSADRAAGLVDRIRQIIAGPGPLVFAGPVPLSVLCSAAPQQLRQALADRMAADDPVTELLHLPDPRTVCTGTLPLPLGDLLETREPSCSPTLFQAHVSDALLRIQTDPGYRAVLTERLPVTVGVLARNRDEVMVFPSGPPTTVFLLTEPRMTSALWDYLGRAAEPEDQAVSVQKLETWLSELENLTDRAGKE